MGMTNSDQLPPEETFYVWREPRVIDGERRLLVPRSDPHEHEWPVDLIFESSEKAMSWIEEDGSFPLEEVKDWILCKEVLTPLPLPRPWKLDEDADEDGTIQIPLDILESVLREEDAKIAEDDVPGLLANVCRRAKLDQLADEYAARAYCGTCEHTPCVCAEEEADPDEEGEDEEGQALAASHKNVVAYTEDGTRYRACRDCGAVWRADDYPDESCPGHNEDDNGETR